MIKEYVNLIYLNLITNLSTKATLAKCPLLEHRHGTIIQIYKNTEEIRRDIPTENVSHQEKFEIIKRKNPKKNKEKDVN